MTQKNIHDFPMKKCWIIAKCFDDNRHMCVFFTTCMWHSMKTKDAIDTFACFMHAVLQKFLLHCWSLAKSSAAMRAIKFSDARLGIRGFFAGKFAGSKNHSFDMRA